MHLGFINIHPITLPLGNEMMHVIGGTYNQAVMLYLGYIKPELTQILEVIDLI